MIPKIFAFQPFYFLVLSRCYAEGGLCDLGGKYRVLLLTRYIPMFPLVGKFFPNRNATHTFFDPIVGITLRLVECPRPLCRQLWVFYFLYPLIANLCKPAFERLRLGRRDGLNDAEDAFSVGTVCLLFTARSVDQKGMYNLYPPFPKFRITLFHPLDVLLGI